MKYLTTTHVITIKPDSSIEVIRTDSTGKIAYHGAVVRFCARDGSFSPTPSKGLTAVIRQWGQTVRHDAGAFVRMIE